MLINKINKINLEVAEVKRVAALARLGLLDAEVGKFQKDLTSILEFISKLNKVDTTNVLPMAHAVGSKNVYRSDTAQRPKKELSDKLIALMPRSQQRQNKVRVVL